MEYGPNGAILPSLAASWAVADNAQGGQEYTFNLRQGVTFHDGTAWDCAAAKLNFDHVLAEPLTAGDWHGWYGLPGMIASVSCPGTHELVLTTRVKYYPLMQELTYIRPLRMLSPAMFVGGLESDPYTQNSCHVGWGNITLADGGSDKAVNCTGTLGVSGTGPWMYEGIIEEAGDNGPEVKEVTFERNVNHWAGIVDKGVKHLRLVRYPNHQAVKQALLNGSLDMVIGSGPLQPKDVKEFQINPDFQVYFTEPLQNRVIVLNTAKAPTNELQVRKVIIHGVNKATIINRELAGLDEPVDALFPKTAPYCHIDLTPRWDYDLEKAKLLNCPSVIESEAGQLSTGFVAGISILVIAAATMLTLLVYIVFREKKGSPLFTPLLEEPVKADQSLPASTKDVEMTI